jgi:hypothetical protein
VAAKIGQLRQNIGAIQPISKLKLELAVDIGLFANATI